jgi:hypothetical protein
MVMTMTLTRGFSAATSLCVGRRWDRIFALLIRSICTHERNLTMAQEQAKEEPKGLFTSIFDGVKNAGSAVVDGVGKASRSFFL